MHNGVVKGLVVAPHIERVVQIVPENRTNGQDMLTPTTIVMCTRSSADVMIMITNKKGSHPAQQDISDQRVLFSFC